MSNSDKNAESPIQVSTSTSVEIATLPDPLVDLAKRARLDPGAPFSPEVLEALRELKSTDLSSFEIIRSKLKKVGCRVSALDDAIGGDKGGDGRAPSQVDILMEIASEADLFHSPDGTAYADAKIAGHRETWPVKSSGFERWLRNLYFEETGSAPNSDSLKSAVCALEASAMYSGQELPVFVRVGGKDDAVYIDLGDAEWRAVEIDASGWRIVECPPVRFRRSAGMQALPHPRKGGSIDQLRPFLNLAEDSEFVLVVSWLIAALRNQGPYPILVISGEQGSSKSTFSSILRSLIDPNTAPLRALPREERDLFISANNSHLLAFDNVSSVPGWLSDSFCRIATGGASVLRQLYSDRDEVLFDAVKPIILNGIEDLISRPDLADRAILLTLAPIPPDRRRPTKELWSDFEEQRPKILGVLLDSISEGLRRLPHTQLGTLPRMADFCKWSVACESHLWPQGTFWEAYEDNIADTVGNIIDDDLVAEGVRKLMSTRSLWSGTASGLLNVLNRGASQRAAASNTWPGNPRALSGHLRRAATFLRKVGIDVTFYRQGSERRRMIDISKTDVAQDKGGNFASVPSAASAVVDKVEEHNAAPARAGINLNNAARQNC